ncbi:hypothetical protein HPP92_024639 [Vanilla planifolia]|uniref:Uncharacterized protein n=1 Tax=Vanilla planifolia TaxID=51239 RepID=A0A835UBC3_VANPL|nr:hypothetical protein HPP92_024639 [Vanilla planifolia]
MAKLKAMARLGQMVRSGFDIWIIFGLGWSNRQISGPASSHVYVASSYFLLMVLPAFNSILFRGRVGEKSKPMAVDGGGGAWREKPSVHPIDNEVEASQGLLEAALRGDLTAVTTFLADPMVDVNYAGVVRFDYRMAELTLQEDFPTAVQFDYEELSIDASALFLASHAGDVSLVRKLLSAGADVNQKLFRGYATTAAAREGRIEVAELLLKAGADQGACEESLLESCRHGRRRLAELFLSSDLIRPRVAKQSLVTAASSGFVDVVDAFIESGLDVNGKDRFLLQSLKPLLHRNVDCSPLIAAIVNRQVSVVRRLLQAGARADDMVQLGAWSWDAASGEEFRVGAGLAEPYGAVWCAVEYFESTGTILRLLLQHCSPNSLHMGRSLLHHAIVCGRVSAVDILLSCGADCDLPSRTASGKELRPLHIAASHGHTAILQRLDDNGSDLDSRTDAGETAAMISARNKRAECIKALAFAGADFGFVSSANVSAVLLAAEGSWCKEFREAVLDAMRSGGVPSSSAPSVFMPLMFAAEVGDVCALEALLGGRELGGINKQDDDGFSAVMVAAREGHVEAFRLLVLAGADVELENRAGDTAMTLSQSSEKCHIFKQVMLELAQLKGEDTYSQRSSARQGDTLAMRITDKIGGEVDVPDGNSSTPMVSAASGSDGSLCESVITLGERCDARTPSCDTPLSLARRNAKECTPAEEVIIDERARRFVLGGGRVKKHTKQGKGTPHAKVLKMDGEMGVLRWGTSARRSVVCRGAELGGSSAFQRARGKKGDEAAEGLFRAVTASGKEVHFVSEGGDEIAELWVRGILLVTKALFDGMEKRSQRYCSKGCC